MSKSFRLTVLCAVLLLCAASAFAASQNAVLYGTVYDASAKPIGGVNVSLENPAIGFSRTTTTASDGTYSFSEVPPAAGYKLTATQAGKAIDIRSNITVNVGEESVVAPPLKAQPTVTAVETSAKEMAVTTDKVATTQSGVITGEQLRSLPLYNRNFLALGTLTPNTHDLAADDSLLGASFSVSGNRGGSNSFLLDGSDNVASSSNQAIPFQVNDAIQEFRVISSASTAEYGRGQGMINVVTRRGSDRWHGSAFGYFASDSFNADTHVSTYNGSGFDKAASYAGTPVFDPLIADPAPGNYNDYVNTAINVPGFCTDGTSLTCNTLFDPAAILATQDSFEQPFDSKQFGVNIGGPLMRGKWFVFGSYEGTLIDNPTPIFERVPSTFDKTYDPYATGTFNFLATDPNYVLGQSVLALYPTANVVAVPNALEFYQGFAPNNTDVHNFLFRTDIVQSDRTNWSARYAAQTLGQLHDSSLPESTTYAGNGANRDAFNQNLNVSVTHSIGSSMVAEAHGGFNRFRIQETPQDAGFDATSIGLPNAAMMTFALSGIDPQYSGAVPGTNGAIAGWLEEGFNFPFTTSMFSTTDGLFPFARIGAPLYAPGQTTDTTWFGGSSLSWNRGRHAWKFGFEYRHLKTEAMQGGFNRGLVLSSNIGEFTSDSATCNALCGAAFSAPAFEYALRGNAPYVGEFPSNSFSMYVQDTWRFIPRLTVNWGLRYEYFGVPEESNGQTWNFDNRANGLVQAGTTTTVDPWNRACGSSPDYTLDANPANMYNFAVLAPVNWNCNATGSGEIDGDANNLAPRFGVAWDVLGNGKTVLRGGGGMYFSQMPTSYQTALMYNRPIGLDAVTPQATYGQAFGFLAWGNTGLDPTQMVNPDWQAAASPFAILARDTERSSTPWSWQLNMSLQQQVTSNVVAEVGYVGNFGESLPVVYNRGFNHEFFCVAPSGCDPVAQFPRYTMSNIGESSYHSLVARLRVAEWHGLRVNGMYTWSSSFDNASNGVFPLLPNTLFNQAQFFGPNSNGNYAAECVVFGAPFVFNPLFGFAVPCPPPGTLGAIGGGISGAGALTTTGAGAILTSPYNIPQDPVHFLRDDWGPSDFQSRHRFVLDYTWEVPSLAKNFNWPKWLDNWQFSGIFMAQSGQPFTIFSGPAFGELTQRVDLLGAVATNFDDPNDTIDASNLSLPGTSGACIGFGPYTDFTTNALGDPCIGDSRRNQFTGPAYVNMNFAVQKGFSLGEGKALTFRTEFFNVFDRANYYNPISAFSLDGVSVNPDFGKIKSAHDPRQIQFGVRFNW
jgi:hypothetical protein